MKKNLLFLNEAEVEKHVPYEKVLELVEQSFIEYSLGQAVNPVKLHLPIYPDYEGYINSMPAYLKRLGIAGAKIVSVYKENAKKHQLPATIGTVLLHDPATGLPYSVMGGTYITSSRTGAVMGVMAKYLAKNNASVLSVVGTGAQGLSGFIMIALALKTVKEVRLVDINPAAQDRFIEAASKIFPDINYVKMSDIQASAKGADMILVAATSEEPLMANIEFDKGATVLIIEEDLRNDFVARFDHFVADFKECLVERINDDAKHHCDLSGMVYEELSLDSVTAEIGDIITGKVSGRANDDEIILAASVGMGIQDIIVAKEAYDRALEAGSGTELDFFGA